jgi:hypothetical protein
MLRIYLLTAALGAFFASQASAQAPAYQRTRGGADDWQVRGGHAQHWRGPYGSYGGFYDPYFAAPPIVTGSYYQRPYPYHFDYYRNRWVAQAPTESSEAGYATPDCPCAVAPPVELVE